MSAIQSATASGIWMTGFKEVEKKLKKLPPNLQRNISRMAMRNGLKIIRDKARDLAPVDTGKLRKAIKTKVSLRSNGDMLGSVFIKTRGKGAAPHAHLVEWGVDMHGQTPYRFMTRTFEMTKDDFFEEYRQIMIRELLKIHQKTKNPVGGSKWKYSRI